MKKKYKCRLSASSLLVNVKGNVLRLEFEPDVVSVYGLRGCSYVTDKEDVQRAIEHHIRFSQSVRPDYIWTDDVEPKAEKAVETPKEEPKKEVEPVVEEVVVPAEPEEEPVVKKTVRRYKAKKEE